MWGIIKGTFKLLGGTIEATNSALKAVNSELQELNKELNIGNTYKEYALRIFGDDIPIRKAIAILEKEIPNFSIAELNEYLREYKKQDYKNKAYRILKLGNPLTMEFISYDQAIEDLKKKYISIDVDVFNRELKNLKEKNLKDISEILNKPEIRFKYNLSYEEFGDLVQEALYKKESSYIKKLKGHP